MNIRFTKQVRPAGEAVRGRAAATPATSVTTATATTSVTARAVPGFGDLETPTGPYLLDPNTLIALIDPQHCQHRRLQRWFRAEALPRGWATCASSERTVFQVMSHPHYPGRLELGAVSMRLRQARLWGGHTFWPDAVDPLRQQPLLLWAGVPGCDVMDDLMLLALARHHNGVLVTLGRRLPMEAMWGTGWKPHWLQLEEVLSRAPLASTATTATAAAVEISTSTHTPTASAARSAAGSATGGESRRGRRGASLARGAGLDPMAP